MHMKRAHTFVTFPEGGVERHFCDISGVCFSKVLADNLW